MANFFERIFHVPDYQQLRVQLLFFFAFTTAASYVVGRSVADSLFLSRVGPERLPEMYFVAAVVVAVCSILYARISSRFSLDRVFQTTLLFLSILTMLIPLLLRNHHDSFFALGGIYLLAQLRGAVGTIQLTTLMNEVFIRRPPARAVGLVGFGSTVAGMLLGGIVGAEADELGTANFLYVVAASDIAGLFLLSRIKRALQPGALDPHHKKTHDVQTDVEESGERAISLPDEAPWQTIVRSRLAVCIALMVVVQTVTLTIVEFQWKVSAHNAFYEEEEQHNLEESLEAEDELTAYFGRYYAVIYAVTGMLQLFITGNYLTRWGLLPALLLFPGALLAASLGILLTSPMQVNLMAITLTKGCETLRRGIYDAAIYLLYWPMRQLERRRSIAFSVGVAKPGSEAISGLVLLELMQFFQLRSLSYFVLGLLCVWISLALVSYRGYLARGGKVTLHPGEPERVLKEIDSATLG